MFTTINILGLILAAVGLADRRAWPFLLVIASVWWMTAWSETHPDRLSGLSYRIGFDVLGGVFTLLLARRKTDFLIPGLFVLMLVNNAVFWMARGMRVDLWITYAWAINVLWVIQMVIVAWPGGLACGRACSSVGRNRFGGGVGSNVGDGRAGSAGLFRRG